MSDENHLKRRWLSVSLLFVGIFVLALVSNYDPLATGKSVLSTLVTAQTGIFAIVFSVVVLGVQLSTSQYAPRLATNFTSDPAYQRTVVIFGASIGLNVIGLFLFAELPQTVLTLILSLSIAVAVGAFLTLYHFVSDTLEKTTPEGILRDIKDRMTPDSMVTEINDSAEDTASPDPFLALIAVIHSFITKKDRASASLGLGILAGRVSALVAFNGDEQIPEDSPLDQSLDNLCTNQIPNTVEEAVNHSLTQVGLEVSETVKTIGEATIDYTANRAFEHVITGHVSLIDTLGFESADERIRTEVMDTCNDLLKKAADKGLWDSAAIGTRRLGWIAAASVMRRDREERQTNRYGSLLILCFPKILNTAVDSYATVDDLSPQDWLRAQLLDVHPVARLINGCYGSMGDLTSAVIRYEMRTEQSLVKWETVSAGWVNGAETLDDSNYNSMAQLWFGTILYLEYLSSVSPDHVMDNFSRTGRHRISSKTIDETIKEIEENNLDPSTVFEFQPNSTNPLEHPLSGYRYPVVPDPDKSFSEWLSEQVFPSGDGGWGGGSIDDIK